MVTYKSRGRAVIVTQSHEHFILYVVKGPSHSFLFRMTVAASCRPGRDPRRSYNTTVGSSAKIRSVGVGSSVDPKKLRFPTLITPPATVFRGGWRRAIPCGGSESNPQTRLYPKVLFVKVGCENATQRRTKRTYLFMLHERINSMRSRVPRALNTQ